MTPSAAIRVVARPRIHIGLVDLSGASSRSYGGVGFSVNAMPTIWTVHHGATPSIAGIDRLDTDARSDLALLRSRLRKICHERDYSATLNEIAEQHIGLGTKTTLCMTLISAINKLNGLALAREEIVAVSGRGGASGIGVNLFFEGGVVWDGGHSRPPHEPFLPSGAQNPSDAPPLLGRWPFPSCWRVAVMLPKGRRANGEYEREFFQRNTPLPRIETLETMSAMYHGVIPGFATHNIELLRTALFELHKVGFKRRELEGQSEHTQMALQFLQKNTNLPVGMSSMGPLLYAVVGPEYNDAIHFLQDACVARGISFLGLFEGWNFPHEVSNL